MEAIKTQLDLSKVSLRDIEPSDIPLIINYWYNPEPGLLDAIGMDGNKFPPISVLEKQLENICSESDKSALVVQYNRKPIGHHILTQLIRGESALSHGHLWNKEFRAKGIVSHTYPIACQVFFSRFELSKILFKVSSDNIGSIRIKYKLGAEYIDQEVAKDGVLKTGVTLKSFELLNKSHANDLQR